MNPKHWLDSFADSFFHKPVDPRAALTRRVTRIATREANAIDELFLAFGIRASVDRGNVAVSETGGFIRYPLRTEGKVNQISSVLDDIAIRISALRDDEVTPVLHKIKLVLEFPYPLDRISLAWKHARLTQLREFQALVGMDYTSLNVKPVLLDWHNAASSNLLISGETGSGKTNGIMGIILSLATSTSPDKAHVVILDPKFSPSLQQLRGLPHVVVYNEPEDISVAMTALKAEINRRKRSPDRRKVFVVMEEISELLMEAGQEKKELVEQATSIAQIGRELGVHVIACTQKAIVKVVETVLRSNLPVRLAFKVGTQEESRVALGQDGVGAERLPGLGAAYFVHNGPAKRIQSYFIDDVEAVVDSVCAKWAGVTPYRLAMQAVDGLPDSVMEEQIETLLSFYSLDQLLDPAKGYSWRHGYQTRAVKMVFGDSAPTGEPKQLWAKNVLPVLQKLARERETQSDKSDTAEEGGF